MNSCELAAMISSIACTIARTCPAEELALLGAAFTQLGDTLTTMSLQNELCSGNTKN